ncbi:hypothetical protein ACFWIQ_33785 [Kitasatospora sp. NPDC127059]|uniref:hypothetical protein n=1 Tax=unclassified Kitasatospora TaxID=2633591 RepID=UPI00365F7DA5
MLLGLLRTRVRPHLRPVGLLLLLQLVQTAAAVALPRLSAVQAACTGGVLLIGSRVAAVPGAPT